ncbi:hypothetical protein Lal_00020954, partial [Lupinus albus]
MIRHYQNTCSFSISTSSTKFTFSNVLRVPSISRNIVSISKFYQENNTSIEFLTSFFRVKELSQGHTIFHCPTTDGTSPWRHCKFELIWGRRILEVNPSQSTIKDLNIRLLLPTKNASDNTDAKRDVELLYDTALISSGRSIAYANTGEASTKPEVFEPSKVNAESDPWTTNGEKSETVVSTYEFIVLKEI